MLVNEKKVHVSDLKIGMYVSRLDRPWVETRFLFQGFRVGDVEDIEELRKYCNYVYVDPDRHLFAPKPLKKGTRQAGRQKDSHKHTGKISEASVQNKPKRQITKVFEGTKELQPERYEIVTSVEEELHVAREIHAKTLDTISNILDDIKAGNKVSIKTVKESVGGLISSILRNPDAFMWLTRLKDKDAYSYAHCVDSCSLSVAMGRYLGFSRDELENLAAGTLLFDIGKLQLPESLLKKPGRLTDSEYDLIRRHVEFGIRLVSEMKGANSEIISIIANHHERHNGTGYPQGICGHQIPVNGRIAALVDCYDAITSERAYSTAISPYEAIQLIYEWRDKDFQSDIVEQFIQCIGLYPTGTLVELSTGEVGIVLAQNRVRRLRPKIMLVLDKNKVAYEFNPTLDLIDNPLDEDGNIVEIRHPLSPGSYGINAKDFYL